MDNGKLNCVVKKPFNSINHKILLDKMRALFGTSGIQLKWFESYLSNRGQPCEINDKLSTPNELDVVFRKALFLVFCFPYCI